MSYGLNVIILPILPRRIQQIHLQLFNHVWFLGEDLLVLTELLLHIGSNVALDYYGVNLMNNIAMNLSNNAITRNNYQFMGGSGQFQGSATPQPLFTRFKLRYYDKDHLNQNGVLPVGKMQKVILSIYFAAAPFCMYYAGAANGTINLNYTLDNLQLQVIEVASPTLDKSFIVKYSSMVFT